MDSVSSVFSASAAAAIDTLRSELDKSRVECDSLRSLASKSAKLEAILADMKDCLEEAVRENSSLQEQCDALSDRAAELERYEKEVRGARALQAELDARISSEKASLSAEVDVLSRQLEEERSRREEAEALCRELEADRIQAVGTIEALTRELDLARAVVEDAAVGGEEARRTSVEALRRTELTLRRLLNFDASLVASMSDRLLRAEPGGYAAGAAADLRNSNGFGQAAAPPGYTSTGLAMGGRPRATASDCTKGIQALCRDPLGFMKPTVASAARRAAGDADHASASNRSFSFGGSGGGGCGDGFHYGSRSGRDRQSAVPQVTVPVRPRTGQPGAGGARGGGAGRPRGAGSVAPVPRALETVTNTFRRSAASKASSDPAAHYFPRGNRATPEAQMRGVLSSLEDELAVLDVRHGQLAREEQILEGIRDAEGREGVPGPGTEERLVEVGQALRAVRDAMAAKGRQVAHLRTVLHALY